MTKSDNPSESEKAQRLFIRQVPVKDRNSIANLFKNVDFPVSKQDLIGVCMNCELIWTPEEPIMLDDVLIEIPQDKFESLEEIIDAVCSVIRLAYGDYSVQDETTIIED